MQHHGLGLRSTARRGIHRREDWSRHLCVDHASERIILRTRHWDDIAPGKHPAPGTIQTGHIAHIYQRSGFNLSLCVFARYTGAYGVSVRGMGAAPWPKMAPSTPKFPCRKRPAGFPATARGHRFLSRHRARRAVRLKPSNCRLRCPASH